jgi:glycosylphosphatidylinositol deacylase
LPAFISPAGAGSVQLVLTMASPHQYPPLLLQPALARFWRRLAAQPQPPHVPLLSIDGGRHDLQVASPLTALAGGWFRSC